MADKNTKEETMTCESDEYSTESEEEMEDEEEEIVEEMSEEEKTVTAETLKEEGNGYYTRKNYQQALELYTKAIEMCPNCAAYYGNRSATYVMLKNYDKALQDARSATQIDPNFVKGHLRIAKCYSCMGEIVAAINAYEKVLELDNTNNMAQAELHQLKSIQKFEREAAVSYEKSDFRKAVYCMDCCITASPGSVKYKNLKAECLALLKRYQEAQEMANDLLRADSSNADAIYVRGMCLYYQDNIDKAFQHFQQVLRFAPDHTKARDIFRKAKKLSQKKEEGNTAFRSGRLQEAYTLYTEALTIDKLNVLTNSKLHFNRATVSSKLGKIDRAIEDCSKAIELDESYLKAYHRRAKCYMDTEQYDEAVRDYEKLCKMDKTRENKSLLQEAKLELKKSQRKDYYKILGCDKTANEDAIKKAYKKRALLHHPDRHSSATEAEQKEQEKKFKEIGEAYTILSDSKKKARYDSGQDLEDMGGGFSEGMDPNQIFQAFFGGGGGMGGGGFPGGMGGHSHGGFQQQQQQGGGFPGGFSFQFG